MRGPFQFALVFSTALFCSSCSSSPKQVPISGLRTTLGFDPRDAAEVAEQMARSIIASNVLSHRDRHGRAVITFSSFRNNTSLDQLDPNILFSRVSVTLNKTGVAYVCSSDDPLVGRHQERVGRANQKIPAQNELLEFTGSNNRVQMQQYGNEPRYALGLELIESASQVGKTVQSAYQVHMTVTDISRGTVVWEDVQDVAKRLH